MINSAKEAREILEIQKGLMAQLVNEIPYVDEVGKMSFSNAIKLQYKLGLKDLHSLDAYAQGYLSALEGPEVRALVDALISFGGGAKIRLEEGDEPYLRWMLELSEKTLAQYREAIKE